MGKITKIEGGVTAAKGFFSASCMAQIKYTDRLDMAMVYSNSPCVSAGTYTTNLVKAAPVVWDRKITDGDGMVQAIVVNAGIANACTGKEGLDYCEQTANEAASVLGIKPEEVLVASTGVIGKQLPMEKIKAGVHKLKENLSDSLESASLSAEAIMTTDTIKKEIALEFEIAGTKVKMGGMCKGSGMIHPNMCTMLGFVTTDVAIDKVLLLKALREDVVDTFNMVSVDGDTSTNDSFIVLANGQAKNKLIDSEGEDYTTFKEALHQINVELVKMMAGDGEGATALFEVKVVGAQSKDQARTLAKSVVTSSLTKAAIFGHDANWGRILCALGYSGEKFDPDHMELWFESNEGKILIYKDGNAVDFSEEDATNILSAKEVRALVDIQMGEETATAWGCDLTYDYIRINADYRS
ncbi:bifunctional glutamate N-acetyltransferase/amino-acid acetyltransferase ArgJ [Lachnospiraceae bacterium oral taxon 096]|jgi:glutamate N-acetyltransferase/amino-acid acetyltransferase|nr:bifunctional glutamate N-acetyltransferase/amino-acid acetyltransferase ArgJ [Lachnospiraceae bacterium oral taxon 096]